MIYKDSELLNNIKQRLTSFKFVEYSADKLEHLEVLTAFPLLYDQEIPVNHNFIINDVLSTTLEYLKQNPDSILEFNHLLSGLEHLSLLSCVSAKSEGIELLTGLYDINKLTSIIKAVDNPIVLLQGKIYKKYKYILHQQTNNKSIYIFMENSFLSSYEFISSEFHSSEYIYITATEFDIVAIKNKNFILIQLVVKGSQNSVKEILEEVNITPIKKNECPNINETEIKYISEYRFKLCNFYKKNKNYGFN